MQMPNCLSEVDCGFSGAVVVPKTTFVRKALDSNNDNQENRFSFPLDVVEHPIDTCWEEALKAPSTAPNGEKPARSVSFHTTVLVRSIPHYTSYKDPKSIWSNQKEISENATRNLLEFAADAWDWRNVTEEPEMVRNLHPIHSNALLASALQRQLPYPRAQSLDGFLEELCDEEGVEDEGAVFSTLEVERPSSPFVEPDEPTEATGMDAHWTSYQSPNHPLHYILFDERTKWKKNPPSVRHFEPSIIVLS